jgi:hypothetical protein
LCVNTVCTAPATTCALGTLVVVDKAFSGDVVGAPLGACYFRSLDEAVAKVAPGTTKVLSVYAAAAGAKAPLDVTGLTFEGHGTTTSQPVTLTVTPAGTAPLVRLGEGSVVRGFALSGPAGQAGLGIETGKAQLAGPLTLAGLSPALSVGGNASVTVVGAAAAPVRLSGNARGIVVGTGASLEMTGEGGESLVLEKGQPDQGELKLTRALVRNNQGSNPTNGSGGVEVRGGRKATVSTNTFTTNNTGITFQGQNIAATVSTNTFTTNNTGITFQGSTGDLFDAFKDVTLAGNDLSNTLPAGGGTGVAICGSSLNADGTTLTVVGTDNQFPTPASCAQLAASAQPSDCNLGTNLGLTGSLNKFGVDCVP